MREIIIHILYTISAFLDDLAFYVVGNQGGRNGIYRGNKVVQTLLLIGSDMIA